MGDVVTPQGAEGGETASTVGDTVALVLKADGSVGSVWASKEAAEAHVAAYNADPFIDGELDLDAPYRVQMWWVTGGRR